MTLLWHSIQGAGTLIVAATVLRIFGRGPYIGGAIFLFGLATLVIVSALVGLLNVIAGGCTITQAILLHPSIGCGPAVFAGCYGIMLAGIVSMVWQRIGARSNGQQNGDGK